MQNRTNNTHLVGCLRIKCVEESSGPVPAPLLQVLLGAVEVTARVGIQASVPQFRILS